MIHCKHKNVRQKNRSMPMPGQQLVQTRSISFKALGLNGFLGSWAKVKAATKPGIDISPSSEIDSTRSLLGL